MVLALKRAEHTTHDEFVDHQKNEHRRLLMSIPEVEQYLRRLVVSYPVPAPGCPGSEFDSIVEAWFDDVADLEALFFSDNFLKVVDPDHENFIDLTSVQQMVCVVTRLTAWTSTTSRISTPSARRRRVHRRGPPRPVLGGC